MFQIISLSFTGVPFQVCDANISKFVAICFFFHFPSKLNLKFLPRWNRLWRFWTFNGEIFVAPKVRYQFHLNDNNALQLNTMNGVEQIVLTHSNEFYQLKFKIIKLVSHLERSHFEMLELFTKWANNFLLISVRQVVRSPPEIRCVF